jgi:hypothetical protein
MWYEYFIIFVIFVVVDETISGKVRRATTKMTMATAQRDTTTTMIAMDVDDKDDKGDQSQSRRWQRRLRIDGNYALATATTQPVVRRRRVKRRRRCNEMRCDNQLAQTKRRGRGWTCATAVQQKVMQGRGTQQQPVYERQMGGEAPADKRQWGLDKPRLCV